jgi:hypothetical protein
MEQQIGIVRERATAIATPATIAGRMPTPG